ncbi:MAG TPA: cytochrome c3 family protein, partial [Gemmatimonadaceae bacterium]|nr:cytochrome c3 family protein [Gemmatimonadaceae bacterium]
MAHFQWRRTRVAVLLGMVTALGACGEDIVYRDAPDYESPPVAAANFLGYSNEQTKRTVCGNCHVGKQADWQATAHAGAWHSLESSGASQASCEGCHSVSSNGNVVAEANVGYVSTKHSRYEDVQCESCHGPGLTHVVNPDLPGNRPFASIAVSATPTNGCGECHSGTHNPFAEQWAGSRHANPPGSRGDPTRSCAACHEAKGALKAWGINTAFIESTSSESHAITCAVCHDPHDATNPKQLRFPVDDPNLETNLCMKCHYRRAAPEVTSSAGPHSPQGPLLLGEAGWFPPNFQFPPKSLVGSHGTDRNPKLCATCHLNRYEINDPATGAFTFRATGHSFQPIPCVDAQGIPTGAEECAITEQSFRACTDGCHLTENAARTALISSRLDIERLVDDLEAMIAQIPASEFSTTDNRISTAEGSRFNAELAKQRGSPIHNPFLVRALLIASMDQIELDYGIASVRAADPPQPRRAPR